LASLLQLRAEESERVVNNGHNLGTTDCDPVLNPASLGELI